MAPVWPPRPVSTQLSQSLTRTQPANARSFNRVLAWFNGKVQSVPQPPYAAKREANRKIDSCFGTCASWADVSNGTTTLPGLRRKIAAANNAATSTQRMALVPPPRWPVTGDDIDPETSSPMTIGP